MLFFLENVRKERRQNDKAGYALTVPELRVNKGDKLLFSGPSGSGKSTVLDMLGLVLKPERAALFTFAPEENSVVHDVGRAWQKRDLASLGRWRRFMGYVLQTGGLLPFLSVRQNIALPTGLAHKPDMDFGEQLARELGIGKLLAKLPGQLSVGERQRVAIARALVNRPALVLADEPTAALDPTHARKVMDMFTDMVQALNLTLILVTHDSGQVDDRGFRHFAIEQTMAGEMVEAVMVEY